MPTLHPATGVVVYKGGKPFTGGGSIQFTPLEDTTLSVTAPILEDGTFNLYTIKGAEKASGAPEGEYRVTVLLPIPLDQRASPPIVLPEPLRVKAGENHFPIELPASGPRP
jgi:hypothetical protein